MIISQKHRFIFVAVGKTATSSVENVIGHLNDIKVPKHTRLSELSDYCHVDTERYFKFCFTRNPWERAVSLYNQWRRPNNLGDEERSFLHSLSQKHDFSEFIKIVSKKRPEVLSTRTTLSFITNQTGEVDIDFVGRFENLQTDFNSVCERIGLEKKKLPLTNVVKKDLIGRALGRQKRYAEYYDEEAQEIVANVFKADIELFKYKF